MHCMVGEQLLATFRIDIEISNSGRNELWDCYAQGTSSRQTQLATTQRQMEAQTGCVGIIQKRATAYVTHANLPLAFWYWASAQAAYMHKVRTLKIFAKTMQLRLDTGSEFVTKLRKITASRNDQRRHISWITQTVQGPFVMVNKDNGEPETN